VELDWWQSHRIGALEITAVPARHWSMRAPWNRTTRSGWVRVSRAGGGRLPLGPDTALFDGFAEIGQRSGPSDWAMLPIGAYEPRWFMEAQHMNPEDAGRPSNGWARGFLSQCIGEPSSSPTSRWRAPPARIGTFFPGARPGSGAPVDPDNWRNPPALKFSRETAGLPAAIYVVTQKHGLNSRARCRLGSGSHRDVVVMEDAVENESDDNDEGEEIHQSAQRGRREGR